MAPDNMDNLGTDALDDLDLDAAIGAAEDLVGEVDDGMGVDLDEVLNADSGADDLGGQRPYDFNRPTTISRVFEQNLQAVAETFAKIGTIDFTSLFRVTTQVEHMGLRQSTYTEFVQELPNPTCVASVTLAPLKGNCLVHIDIGLCFVFLKKLMGGSVETEDSVREFTEIERGINAGLVGRFTEIFRKATQKWVEIQPQFGNLENNANYLSGIADGESMIILKFLVKVDNVEGQVELAFPLAAFGPVRDIFDPEIGVEFRTTGELKEDRRRILEMVRSTTTEMTAQLTEMDTSLEEIMNMKVGDVIPLHQGVNAPLKILIEGQDAWLGEAGRLGQNRAIKLIQQLKKE